MTVPMATTTGAKNLPLTVNDAQARSGSGNISLTVTTPPAPHDPSEHLVMGNPNGATADTAFPDNYLMMKLQYALSYNNTREIPNWTSWHLDSTWRGSARDKMIFVTTPRCLQDFIRCLVLITPAPVSIADTCAPRPTEPTLSRITPLPS